MSEIISKIAIICNKRTSIKLVAEEWIAVEDICQKEGVKRNYLLEKIYIHKNDKHTFTSAIRLFVLAYYYHISKDNIHLAIFYAIEAII